MAKNTEKQMKLDQQVRSFMSNVNKLDEYVHTRTHGRGKIDCTVELWRPGYLNNGTRMFKVSGSKLIRNGSYGYGALTKALRKALGC